MRAGGSDEQRGEMKSRCQRKEREKDGVERSDGGNRFMMSVSRYLT